MYEHMWKGHTDDSTTCTHIGRTQVHVHTSHLCTTTYRPRVDSGNPCPPALQSQMPKDQLESSTSWHSSVELLLEVEETGHKLSTPVYVCVSCSSRVLREDTAHTCQEGLSEEESRYPEHNRRSLIKPVL